MDVGTYDPVLILLRISMAPKRHYTSFTVQMLDSLCYINDV